MSTEVDEVDEVDEFLAHYGIKGMKWGKRKRSDDGTSNNPKGLKEKTKTPKELSERKQAKVSKFEAKAAKRDVFINELTAELDSIPPGMKNHFKRANLTNQIVEQTAYRDRLKKDAEAVRNGKMTRGQKQLLIGAIAVTGIMAAGYLSVKADSGELNAAKLRGAAFLKGEKFEFKKNDMFAKKDLSPDDVLANVVKGVNPNYKKPGGSMNCRRASMTYELRRRGYDVQATTSPVGRGQSESGLINALTPGQKNKNYSESMMAMLHRKEDLRAKPGTGKKADTRSNPAETRHIKAAWDPNNLKKALGDHPDGARGEIVFNFGKFGHSMSWEMFEGKPVIFDTQKAAKYPVDEEGMSKMMRKWGTISNAEATRLDNVDLDLDFLARWATNAK